ncbi:MAG: hypothetical protein ACRYF2_22935 [Janthinobacterium lividum]
MKRADLTSMNIVEIRQQIMVELAKCERENKPWRPSKKRVSCKINFIIGTHIALTGEFGIEPYGDMLPHLGWPGQVLHELLCKSPGTMTAFRKLVERAHGLPWRTSTQEGDVVLDSIPERFLYRLLLAMSGVTCIIVHPPIPAGSGRMRADFLLHATTGRSVYVELAMVDRTIAQGERSFLADYRAGLKQKLRLCQTMDIDPVVIWADEAAAPRVLAERLNDIRARLDLPTRPPAPLAWYEEIV